MAEEMLKDNPPMKVSNQELKEIKVSKTKQKKKFFFSKKIIIIF